MSTSQDYVALDWIKGEISQTLDQARDALEAVAESPDDAGGMRSCLTSLHQVYGTLQMVELSGPAQVADEMEQLAQSLMNSSVPDVSTAQEILTQTILQMPGYLDLIQREQDDSEKNYLPLVNNLRIARGEERIGGSAAEAGESGVDLSPVLTAPGQNVIDAFVEAKGEANVPKLRQRYHQALAELIKKNKARDNLLLMGKVFSMLIKICGESPIGNLSQLGIALVEGVATGAVKLGMPVAEHFKAIDAELVKLSEGGVAALSEPVSEELVLGLVEEINNARKDTPKIIAAKEIFTTTTEAAGPEQVSIGPDDETLAAVSRILIEELNGITDKLDLYVRSSERSVSDLVELLPNLEQVASTLIVVGLPEHQQAVSRQLEIIRGVEESGENPDEETLLDMAKDLLNIEAALGSIVGETDDELASASFGDLDEAQAAVVRETRVGLAKCRDALIDFVSSDFDHAKLESLPDDLSVLRGGLMIVNQQRSGDVLTAASRYVNESLLKDRVQPELSAMDDLADAITSIDYYLERLLESAHDPYVQMIEVAEAAVEKLGFKAGEETPAVEEETDDVTITEDLEESQAETEVVAEPESEVVPEPELEVVTEPESEAVPEPESEAVAEPEPEVVAEQEPEQAPATSDEEDFIDEEILEIFVEEVEEVLETITEYFPQWQANYGDEEAQTELRRAFHTLKGSGRMVGATVLGELAWSIENMLNRVIDDTIQPGASMGSLILDVVASVPGGLEQFRGQNQQAYQVDEMIARAEAITAGKEVEIEQEVVVEAVVDEVAEDAIPEVVEEEVEIEEVAPEDADVEEVLPEVVEEELEIEEVPAEEVAEPEALIAEDDDAGEDEVEILTTEEPLEEYQDEETGLEETAQSAAEDDFDLAELQVGEAGGDQEDIALEDDQAADEASPVSTAAELLEDDDLELEEIFTIEANERIEVVQQFLDSHDTVSGDLVAAFHTLKGSAAMAEIPSISAIAAPLELLANQYLAQGATPDAGFVNTINNGTELIKAIIGNLAEFRDGIEGMDAQIAESQALQVTSPGKAVAFSFEHIKLLANEGVVSSDWQNAHVDAVMAELTDAQQQADKLGQSELNELVTSLLRIYGQIKSVPDETVASALEFGHESLVIMFDQIAASQDVLGAGDVLALLNSVEIEPVAVVEEAVAADVDEETEDAPVEEVLDTTEDSQEQTLPEDDIDEDILPIFLEEAEELLEGIDQSILDWSEDTSATECLDNLLRHLHTLKGGSRMAGLNSLGEYTHNFETFLIGVQQNPLAFDDAFFALLNQRQDEITRRVEIYNRAATGEASEGELQSLRFDRDVGKAPEPGAGTEILEEAVEIPKETSVAPQMEEVDLPADEIDEDVLPIFLEETDELLEGIDASIQNWSEDTGSTEHLDMLLRHLHTLKGGARMAGMNSLGEFTHNFESFLIGIQQNPVDLNQQFFALLNQRQDEITRRVGIYVKLGSGKASEEELTSLTKDVAGDSAPAMSDAGTPSEEAKPAEEKDDAAKGGPASQSQEMVRVSADLLEELISLSGESNITRGRVEQQISDFGEAIQEMETVIGRIRDQVRRLEIEAESRETLIRSHSVKNESSFDELEMDRYTMLQEISRTLNESSSDMLDLKETLVNRSRDAEALLHQQSRIGSELQEGLTRTRMVPFARLIPRLRRIVRQVSGEINKSVRFDAFNIEGELDRSVLERIVAPLEHMLRNAVDHGIESAERRQEAGKPEQGRISLRLSREGGYVILKISDDGGGINVEAVRGKAIDKGLITEESDLSDHDVMQFILDAGFSTAQKVTQISGRGVGMDVVVSEIKALGGTISINSTVGVGTEFTIGIPFTVSINRALMVVVKEETYAVPLNSIEGIVRVSPYELEAYYQPEAPMFEYAGQPYRLNYLGRMLSRSDVPDLTGMVAPLPVILARSGDHAVALQIDKVIGSREVVVKTLGPQFNEVGGIAGATILGDGSVVIILDVMALVRTHELQKDVGVTLIEPEEVPEPKHKIRTIMIVDDSVTVRKVTSRLMERQGWEVATAKDGVDAVNQLQEIYPDVVLLDIEMPKMDGFEVLRTVRRDERLKNLPIIMITSRTGEKHKQEALDLGVNRYLGKPFQEANLLSTIEEVIAEQSSGKAAS